MTVDDDAEEGRSRGRGKASDEKRTAQAEKVFRRIDQSQAKMLDVLGDLVKVASTPGDKREGVAQQIIAREYGAIEGLRLDVWEPTQQEVERYPLHPKRLRRWDYKGRPNVVGVLGSGDNGGRSLILNGHIDVVGAGPRSDWHSDPWTLRAEGGRLFGRGTVDMKGGLVSMLFAAKSIVDSGLQIGGRLILESVSEEEFGGGGTISTILRGYTADAAIVAEGTGSRNLCIGCAGSRFFRVSVAGKSEIPARAHLGVDAIGLALKVYRALKGLDDARVKRLAGRNPLFERRIRGDAGPLSTTGRATNMTMGSLRSGDFPSVVSGWAELEGRIGFPPGESGAQIEAEFERTVRETGRRDPWMKKHPPQVLWFNSRKEPYLMDTTEPIVGAVREAIESMRLGRCRLFATPGNTDTAYLAPRVGRYGGIPSVVYGPSGGNAHAPDEYLDLKDLMVATKVLALSIMDWCGYEMR